MEEVHSDFRDKGRALLDGADGCARDQVLHGNSQLTQFRGHQVE